MNLILGGGRAAFGLFVLARPEQVARLLVGHDPSASGRLFLQAGGARDVALGVLQATAAVTDDQPSARVAFAVGACDLVDAALLAGGSIDGNRSVRWLKATALALSGVGHVALAGAARAEEGS